MAETLPTPTLSYWMGVWYQLRKRPLAVVGLFVLALFIIVGIYAPLLASSKPLVVRYEGSWYFPLFRYLFFNGFYTKNLDIFFNLLIFTFPLFLLAMWWWRHQPPRRSLAWLFLVILQIAAFSYLLLFPLKDPAVDISLIEKLRHTLQQARRGIVPTNGMPQPGQWAFDLEYMNDYAKLNLVLRYRQHQEENAKLERYGTDYRALEERRGYSATDIFLPTLWQLELHNEAILMKHYRDVMAKVPADSTEYRDAATAIEWFIERRRWLEEHNNLITVDIMPLIRPYHWEDDAAGDQAFNHFIPWINLTRINRKDLVAALIFGVRISLVVGIIAVALSLAIGVPIGAVAGYYGGTFDILVCRLLEIWETMPAFLMLLMVVAIAQSKSIFLVISVIAIFGWTSFSRYIRGEFFKQRNLAYVEACRSLGFGNSRIIFHHILPNAVPPVLTLMPFAIMSAVSSEAGLSFLGLGEENSCSWGVLMDEGRSAFPGESYLLWPPAILLTTLLVATALVGDGLRDAIDPKLAKG